MADTIFEISSLTKSFGENRVLKGVDLTVKQGEVISVIGLSGSGKSTFLRCLNVLETPDGGTILYRGENVLEKNFDLTAYRTKVGMVFQQFNLFNNMSVLKNCTIGRQKVLGESFEKAKEYIMKNNLHRVVIAGGIRKFFGFSIPGDLPEVTIVNYIGN